MRTGFFGLQRILDSLALHDRRQGRWSWRIRNQMDDPLLMMYGVPEVYRFECSTWQHSLALYLATSDPASPRLWLPRRATSYPRAAVESAGPDNDLAAVLCYRGHRRGIRDAKEKRSTRGHTPVRIDGTA